MTEAPLLDCRNVSISYAHRDGRVPAVVDFSLSLGRGETHGLVGESGCGKSTVALAIMRYLGRTGRVDGGQILFQGRDLLRMSERELRKVRGGDIAMVYQEPMASLNPAMTVGEQLIEVPVAHEGCARSAARERARGLLGRVRLADPERVLRAYPHQLSGGQQQRIVIAMALLAHPKLLVLDEPTTALDVTVEAEIVGLIKGLAAELGTALLFISHNLGLIRESCDRLTIMYAGEAVEVGQVGEVFAAVRHPYTRGLLESLPTPDADKRRRPLRPIPGQVASPAERPPGCCFAPRCEFAEPGRCDAQRVPLLDVGMRGAAPAGPDGAPDTGRAAPHVPATREPSGSTSDMTKAIQASPTPPPRASRCLRVAQIDWRREPRHSLDAAPAPTEGAPCIVARGVTKRFGRVSANEDLSFDARRAETVAIVGESGCGKSTLARIVMGLTRADSGAIEIAALEGAPNLARLGVGRRTKSTLRALQMIFQNPFDTLNPSHTVGAQLARAVRKLGGERDEARVNARVLELLQLVKLPPDVRERRPRQLSGGQKQRIGIARAFAGHPMVVVADEPVSALDVSVQAAVTELLVDIQRRESTTLLFISHDLSVVRYLSDRILVMYLGRIMEQGRTEEIFAPPYHPYTEALLAAVPIADGRFSKRRVELRDEMPSASRPPAGCRFSTRCAYRIEGLCADVPPPVREFAAGHRIACHLTPEQLTAMRPVFERVSA